MSLPTITDWPAAALLAAGVVRLTALEHKHHLVTGTDELDFDQAARILRAAHVRGVSVDVEQADACALEIIGAIAARDVALEAAA